MFNSLPIMKILVVHRQEKVTSQIKLALDNNAIIRYANSGLDGLLAARVEAFDLIICSTDLPMVTGFELVRSLRTSSVNKNTPVIFLADNVVDEKTEYLGNALGVAAMMAIKEVDSCLAGIVNDKIKPEPDREWISLLSEPERMN
jgi:DNA-binding response OmpR family regulator